MNARRAFVTLKQLIRDTFRQAWASGIFGMMLAVTAICVVLCLSVSVSGDVVLHSDEQPLFLARDAAPKEGLDPVTGQMSLAFGAISFPVARERADSVRFLELI